MVTWLVFYINYKYSFDFVFILIVLGIIEVLSYRRLYGALDKISIITSTDMNMICALKGASVFGAYAIIDMAMTEFVDNADSPLNYFIYWNTVPLGLVICGFAGLMASIIASFRANRGRSTEPD